MSAMLIERDKSCLLVVDVQEKLAPAVTVIGNSAILLRAALQRLRENAVDVATTEMVVFEWLGQAGTPEFKDLSKLIR